MKKKVPGYIIDKQFELTDYFLLFISWDCPFEEGCEIVVVNKHKKVVGSYSIGVAYNSYNLHAVTEISNNHYKLTFSGAYYLELCINYPKKNWFSNVVTVSVIDA